MSSGQRKVKETVVDPKKPARKRIMYKLWVNEALSNRIDKATGYLQISSTSLLRMAVTNYLNLIDNLKKKGPERKGNAESAEDENTQ